jgi:PAS domain S-box-containing protein
VSADVQSLLEKLFAQNVAGVFVVTLDEPIAWRDAADPEALLDYAFAHLRLVEVNDAMCRQLADTRERLLGTVPRDRWTTRQLEWREAMRRLYDRGQVHHTVDAPRADGTWSVVEGEYMCTYDDAGRITGHVGTQRDVTDRVRIATALAESQDRLQAAVSGADLGVWDLDIEADAIRFEGCWLERFGYPEADAGTTGTWWRSNIHPADLPLVQAAMADHVAGAKPVFTSELRFRASNGDWRWLLTRGRVTTREADGRPSRMVGTTVDITEQRRLQGRLAASERLASLGTLAAGVAHEINNPLTYIALTLELFGRELGGMRDGAHAASVDKLGQLVEQMREGTDRVRRIVRDLQVLSRSPDQRLTVFDPIQVITRCLSIVDHQLRHRARIERAFEPAPPVRGDEGRLEQVFLNLLVNAAQAIPEGAADKHWIRVRTATGAGGRAVIEIADSGGGISGEDLERIFDPFFTTKPIGEGTGLGLAIARTIVVGMAGDIEVESTPGRGALFRVILPASAAPSIDAGAAAPARTVPASVALRLLVIDDEPAVGESVASILANHQVSVETSGRAALARLRAGERFDRILCDLMMPEVTGMDFYDQLGAIDPDLPARVVFVTGGAFTERARTFLARVPNPRLDKPFDIDQLLTLVARR